MSSHSNNDILRRINEIYYLKDLAIFFGIQEPNLRDELGFIDLFFNNMAKMNMLAMWDELDVKARFSKSLTNSQNYLDNKIKVTSIQSSKGPAKTKEGDKGCHYKIYEFKLVSGISYYI